MKVTWKTEDTEEKMGKFIIFILKLHEKKNEKQFTELSILLLLKNE